MREQNCALSNFEYGRGHSKIMRSKRGRKNRDFERHRSLAERYRYRRWREKRGYPDGLPRLRARTPCCKQLFGENSLTKNCRFRTLWEHFWVREHRMPIWLVFGSDSSNLIETRMQKNLMFVMRIAPLDAFIFPSSRRKHFNYRSMTSTFVSKTIHLPEMKYVGRRTHRRAEGDFFQKSA